MKRSLIFCLVVLLAGSSVALAENSDQDRTDRPRRVALSSSGFLGVDLAEVTSDVVGRLKLREERGALVTGITTDTAASKAGLQKDDVIVKWNGEAIESASQLGRRIRETPIGREVKLGVARDGREIEINVTMGDRGQYLNRYRANASQVRSQIRNQIRDQVRQARQTITRVGDHRNYRMGISLQRMSPQLAEYFGLKDRNGALVVFVHPDTAAAKAGIKAGDVILSIGGEAVDNPLRVHQVLRSKSEGPIEVKVMRDRQERTFTIQLEKADSSLFISPDDFGDIVVEVPQMDIEPLHIEPIHIAPLVQMAVPAVRVAPIKIAPIAPIKISPIIIAPAAMPEIHIAPVRPPKISIPPLKLIMPKLVFINPV